MFLKCRVRRKDGKIHRSRSNVESRRYSGGKVAHRHVLYLGEINDSVNARLDLIHFRPSKIDPPPRE